jgi:hypothetical protein
MGDLLAGVVVGDGFQRVAGTGDELDVVEAVFGVGRYAEPGRTAGVELRRRVYDLGQLF